MSTAGGRLWWFRESHRGWTTLDTVKQKSSVANGFFLTCFFFFFGWNIKLDGFGLGSCHVTRAPLRGFLVDLHRFTKNDGGSIHARKIDLQKYEVNSHHIYINWVTLEGARLIAIRQGWCIFNNNYGDVATVVETLKNHRVGGQLPRSLRFSSWQKDGELYHLSRMVFQYIAGWWFQIFFMFTSIFGKDSYFDWYFSNGSKPPSRLNTQNLVI